MRGISLDGHARLILPQGRNMDVLDPPQDNPDRGLDRVTSLGVLIAILSAVVAGAIIWLVVTDPVTVASAVEGGEVSPLVRRLAEVLYNALSGLLAYL
jgi:flagellar basal body-associated protein FliL